MFTLTDTFNNSIISRHRSLLAAVRAERKHARAIRLRNGGNAYVTYKITKPDGSGIDWSELQEAREAVRCENL